MFAKVLGFNCSLRCCSFSWRHTARCAVSQRHRALTAFSRPAQTVDILPLSLPGNLVTPFFETEQRTSSLPILPGVCDLLLQLIHRCVSARVCVCVCYRVRVCPLARVSVCPCVRVCLRVCIYMHVNTHACTCALASVRTRGRTSGRE